MVGLEPTRRLTPVPKTGTSTIPPQRLYLLNNKILLILNNVNSIVMLKLKQLLKTKYLNKNVNILIFFILLSFVLGNIFGLNSQYLIKIHSSLNFFIFPFLFEIFNFFNFFFKKKFPYNEFSLIYISIRRGFFLGIFMEAFKVGS